MHGAYIQTTQTPQAVLQASTNDATRRSSANQPFSLAWQREMSTGSVKADETTRSVKVPAPAQPKMNAAVEGKSHPEAKPATEGHEPLQEGAPAGTSTQARPGPRRSATPDTELNPTPDTKLNASPTAKPTTAQNPGPIATPSAKTDRPSIAASAATRAVDAKKKYPLQLTSSHDSIQISKPLVDLAPQIADSAVIAASAGVAAAAIGIDTTTASAVPAGSRSAKVSAAGTKRQLTSDASQKNAVAKTPLAADPRTDVDAHTSAGKVAERVVTAASGAQARESQWAGTSVDRAAAMHSNPASLPQSAGGLMDVGTQQASTPGHISPVLHVGAELRSGVLNMTGAEESGAAPNQGHQMLAAGPRQLEVGLVDGTHGWLQIRAELGAGGAVSASLTGSAAAHEPLRQAVPEMASYLESEAVSVSQIAVHRAAETSPSMGQAQYGSGQDRNGPGGNDQSDHDSQQNSRGHAGSPGKDSVVPSGYEIGPASGAASFTAVGAAGRSAGQPDWMRGISPAVFGSRMPFGMEGGSGSWLSVLA
jgi:hypothetical protein